MAQSPQRIEGEYENFLYGPPEKNHYHYVTVLPAVDNGVGYIWRTLCNEWTLTPIKDQQLTFAVGEQCPYFKNGYTTMKFKTDHKGNIVGAFGPGNEYFTKVERHSTIKYNLKGVKKPKQEQKETEGAENDDNETYYANDNDNDANQAPMKMATTFEWKGGQCAKSKCIGRVSVDGNFVISFGMVVHGKVCDEWENILHVGHENNQRSPGIWLYPKSYRLHVRLSDTTDWNSGYDPNVELEKGVLYKIKLQCIDNQVSLFINDKLDKFASNVLHVTRYQCPVFVSDPWYTAANVTISDLKIFAPK